MTEKAIMPSWPVDRNRFPHYPGVPKGIAENVAWRAKILKKAAKQPRFRDKLMDMVRDDLLFWINGFVWTFNPKYGDEGVMPFITYEFQDKALAIMQENLGHRDMAITKSRYQGATFFCLYLFAHPALFLRNQVFELASRTYAKCADRFDPDSLFWKLEFTLKYLPPWMIPKLKHKEGRIVNTDLDSTIGASATIGDIGRGGRTRALGLDEFAAFRLSDGFDVLKASQYNTDCRVFNSTPKGRGTAHYQIMQRPSTLVIRLPWWEHPVQKRGLYKSEKGRLVILDKDYEFPVDYPFILDDTLRSPYYDHECERMVDPAQAAQELDMDEGAAESQFLTTSVLDELIAAQARPPCIRGNLARDPMSDYVWKPEFVPDPAGPLWLWMPVDVAGRLPSNRFYVSGADIATGSAAARSSNSALVAYDAETGTKILEYASPTIRPEQFAHFTLAFGTWLKGAGDRMPLHNYESNGRGLEYGVRLQELGYGPIWQRAPGKFGWNSTAQNKHLLLSSYCEQLRAGTIINRSERALRELAEFRNVRGGGVEHVASIWSLDPTGASDQHGDIAIADAVAALCLKKAAAPQTVERQIPENCPFTRRQARIARQGMSWNVPEYAECFA